MTHFPHTSALSRRTGILNDSCDKSKWMHWHTLWRLQARHDALVQQTMAGMVAEIGKYMARLDAINETLADLKKGGIKGKPGVQMGVQNRFQK